jgi:spore germination cell wall hydrolase CwlJ-like protein
MFHRFALMVAAAAFAASSVAPAQVPKVADLAQLSTIQASDVVLPVTRANLVLPSAKVTAEPLVSVDGVSPVPAPLADEPEDDAAPAVRPGASLSEKIAANRSAATASRELECLAVGVYFESKGEPLAGQMAVAHVIANRANSRGRFPSSYCGVLFQRGQFSFIRAGGWPPIAKNGSQWKTAVAVARLVHGEEQSSNVGKAMFFHAKRVSPGWKLTRVAAIGNHVFYR